MARFLVIYSNDWYEIKEVEKKYDLAYCLYKNGEFPIAIIELTQELIEDIIGGEQNGNK